MSWAKSRDKPTWRASRKLWCTRTLCSSLFTSSTRSDSTDTKCSTKASSSRTKTIKALLRIRQTMPAAERAASSNASTMCSWVETTSTCRARVDWRPPSTRSTSKTHAPKLVRPRATTNCCQYPSCQAWTKRPSTISAPSSNESTRCKS